MTSVRKDYLMQQLVIEQAKVLTSTNPIEIERIKVFVELIKLELKLDSVNVRVAVNKKSGVTGKSVIVEPYIPPGLSHLQVIGEQQQISENSVDYLELELTKANEQQAKIVKEALEKLSTPATLVPKKKRRTKAEMQEAREKGLVEKPIRDRDPNRSFMIEAADPSNQVRVKKGDQVKFKDVLGNVEIGSIVKLNLPGTTTPKGIQHRTKTVTIRFNGSLYDREMNQVLPLQ